MIDPEDEARKAIEIKQKIIGAQRKETARLNLPDYHLFGDEFGPKGARDIQTDSEIEAEVENEHTRKNKKIIEELE